MPHELQTLPSHPNTLHPHILANFPEWRENQRQYTETLLASPLRFKVLCGPTGSGKSLIYMAYAAQRINEAMGTKGRPSRVLVLTSSKHLQDQIIRDFPQTFVFKGKANYPCILQGGWPNDCGDSAPCHAGTIRCQLKDTTCEYYRAKRMATRAPIVVANYALWAGLSWGEKDEGEAIGAFDTVICDEAHNIRNIVTQAIAPVIPMPMLMELGLKPPAADKHISGWLAWADKDPAVLSLLSQVEDYQTTIKEGGELSIAESKRFRKMKSAGALISKLRIIGQGITPGCSPGEWILTNDYDGRKGDKLFQPLQPAPYCERIIYRGIKDCLLTSATISSPSCIFLGLPMNPKDRFFLEAPSTFPAERRRFHLMPVAKIDSKMPDSGWDEIVSKLAEFLRSRKGRRGILHVTSYDKGVRIAHGLGPEFQSRIILQQRGQLNQAVAQYLQTPGGFLISPAISEGLNLPGPDCCFNIILKTPFPDTRDPLTAARSSRMPQITHLEIAEKIEQSAGRGSRSKEDFCENYILDAHFYSWVYRKINTYFTQSFRLTTKPLHDCKWPSLPPLPWESTRTQAQPHAIATAIPTRAKGLPPKPTVAPRKPGPSPTQPGLFSPAGLAQPRIWRRKK